MLRVVVLDSSSAPADRWSPSGSEPWQIMPVGSLDDAVRAVEDQLPDIVITDDAAIDLNGGGFLRVVQNRWPRVVRVLGRRPGGPPNPSPAHVEADWPTDPGEMAGVLFRAAAFGKLLTIDQLTLLFPLIGRLPSVPQVWAELTAYLGSEDPDPRAIGRIVSRDAGLAASVLRHANSPLVGLTRRVTSIEQAVSLIGIPVVRNRVLATEIERVFPGPANVDPSAPRLSAHGFACGLVACQLVGDRRDRDTAMTAAVLQDVGQLALAQLVPEQTVGQHKLAMEREMALHEVENLSVGITHADVGAELLRHWGLPVDVTEPVRSHHDLTPPKAAKLTVGQAVVAARLLLGAQGGLNDPADPLAPSDLEPWQPVFDQLPPAAQQLMTAIAEHGDSRETAGV